jgi:hypothetical protein
MFGAVVLSFVMVLQVGGSSDNLIGATEDPAGPAYTPDEILDEVGNMFGQDVADAIGNSGVGIVEVEWPVGPRHDRNTIGVDTRPPTNPDHSGPMYPLSAVGGCPLLCEF